MIHPSDWWEFLSCCVFKNLRGKKTHQTNKCQKAPKVIFQEKTTNELRI